MKRFLVLAMLACTSLPARADTAVYKSFDLSVTSPSSASTSVGTQTAALDIYSRCMVFAKVQGATGGSLDLYLQTTYDGTNWHDAAHLTQLAAGGAQVAWSFAIQRGGTATAPVAVNTASGTPSMAANTVLPFSLGISLRLVLVAGASTSAGAAQTVVIGCSSL